MPVKLKKKFKKGILATNSLNSVPGYPKHALKRMINLSQLLVWISKVLEKDKERGTNAQEKGLNYPCARFSYLSLFNRAHFFFLVYIYTLLVCLQFA